MRSAGHQNLRPGADIGLGIGNVNPAGDGQQRRFGQSGQMAEDVASGLGGKLLQLQDIDAGARRGDGIFRRAGFGHHLLFRTGSLQAGNGNGWIGGWRDNAMLGKQ